MLEEEAAPITLRHALLPARTLTFPARLVSVTHLRDQRQLLSLDSDGVAQLHHEDGRLCSRVQLPWRPHGLLYAAPVHCYLAWTRQQLLLLGPDLQLLQGCAAPTPPIMCCALHPSAKLALTGGGGAINIWSLAHNGRSLAHRCTLRDGMPDHVTIIAIDQDTPTATDCLAACGTNVYQYDLTNRTLRRVRRNLHSRPVSSLVYSELRHLLISGSRDRTIKVWAEEGELLAVLGGHTGAVTALSLDPSGTPLVSGSEDGTLRVWDVDSRGQVQVERLSWPVIGAQVFGEGRVLCYGGSALTVWRMRQLYDLQCTLGSSVAAMTVSGGVALCVCGDGELRVIAAGPGELLSSLHPPTSRGVLQAHYSAPHHTVCALLDDGRLLRAEPRDNPMILRDEVTLHRGPPLPRCFSLYTLIMDARSQQEEGRGQEPGNRVFVVLGLEDGVLSVCHWDSGRDLCHMAAHCPAPVTSITTDPKNNLILSAGADLMVKVWRFFPHADESLSPHMSFYSALPPAFICCFKLLLYVAFQEDASATYSLVQYCLRSRIRRDHPAQHDHQDRITGLCGLAALRLAATSGRDRTIRLWDHQNQLIRVLCLDAVPASLAFSGERGDLLVAMRCHVYRIGLAKLLPRSYRVKLLCMEATRAVADPSDPPPEPPQPEEETRGSLQPLFPPLRTCDGAAPPSNGEQEQECQRMCDRDRDAVLIREGKLRQRKKAPTTAHKKREALGLYLQRLYMPRPPIKIGEEDDTDVSELLPSVTAQEEGLTPLSDNKGFFGDSPGRRQVGFIPNSAILQLLSPSDQVTISNAARRPEWHWREVREVAAILDEASEEEAEEDEERAEVPALLLKMASALEEKKRETPAADPEHSAPLPQPATPLLAPPLLPPPLLATPKPRQRKAATVQRRIPEPGPRLTQSPIQPVLPASSGPPPITAPAPEAPPPEPALEEMVELHPMVLQFRDAQWFSRIFPDMKVEVCEFEACVRREVLRSDPLMRLQLLQALNVLHHQGQLQDPRGTFRTLLEAITSGPAPNMEVEEERLFLGTCLQLMVELCAGSKELVLELLVSCVRAPPWHRGTLLRLFKDMGVEDPHGFLGRQCDAWDWWESGEDCATLRRTCKEWLEDWSARLIEALRGHQHQLRPAAAIEVSPSDVLNYFCQLQLRDEIQPIRDEVGGNTVLALPPAQRKRALLRLGESGKRTTHINCKAIGQRGVPSQILFINLPVKKISIQPFTTDAARAPAGSLRQDAQRYFILQQSYGKSHVPV